VHGFAVANAVALDRLDAGTLVTAQMLAEKGLIIWSLTADSGKRQCAAIRHAPSSDMSLVDAESK
jgi:hypothetical protein